MTKDELRKVRGILVRARARIEDPKRWCVDVLARDPYGRGVSLEELSTPDLSTPVACQWCAYGAMYAEYLVDGHDLWLSVLEAANIASYDLYGESVPTVNDTIGHHAVMTVFDRAINDTLNREAKSAEAETA